MASRRTLIQRRRAHAVGKAGVKAGTLTEYQVILADPKGTKYGQVVTAGNENAAKRRAVALKKSQAGGGTWRVVGVRRIGYA